MEILFKNIEGLSIKNKIDKVKVEIKKLCI